MKSKLFFAFIMLTTITFSQSKNDKITNPKNSSKAVYVKIGSIKGESTKKSAARFYQKRKFSESELKEKARRRGDVKMTDVSLDKKKSSNKRRRVIVAKSNKQGDPNKKNK